MIKHSLLIFSLLSLVASFNIALERVDAAEAPSVRPGFKRVFIVVLENGNADAALKQPNIKAFADRGVRFSQWMAATHPSQPNYLAMTSGNTWDVTDDRKVTLDVRSIADLLEEKGLSWKAYAENYPGNCFLGAGKGYLYARKHVPFLSYRNIQADPARCANVVNAEQLDADIRNGHLPDYSLYVPNQWNQGHFPATLRQADKFVGSRILPLTANPAFMKDMLLVLTFDENDKSTPNRIYTVFQGDSVASGQVSDQPCTHYSLLRTIEEAFGLDSLGQGDAKSNPISRIWK